MGNTTQDPASGGGADVSHSRREEQSTFAVGNAQ